MGSRVAIVKKKRNVGARVLVVRHGIAGAAAPRVVLVESIWRPVVRMELELKLLDNIILRVTQAAAEPHELAGHGHERPVGLGMRPVTVRSLRLHAARLGFPGSHHGVLDSSAQQRESQHKRQREKVAVALGAALVAILHAKDKLGQCHVHGYMHGLQQCRAASAVAQQGGTRKRLKILKFILCRELALQKKNQRHGAQHTKHGVEY